MSKQTDKQEPTNHRNGTQPMNAENAHNNELATTQAEAIAKHALAVAGLPENDQNLAAALTEIEYRHPAHSTYDARQRMNAAHDLADDLSRETAATAVTQIRSAEAHRGEIDPRQITAENIGAMYWLNPRELPAGTVRGIADALTSGDAFLRTPEGSYAWPDAKCIELVAQWLGTDQRTQVERCTAEQVARYKAIEEERTHRAERAALYAAKRATLGLQPDAIATAPETLSDANRRAVLAITTGGRTTDATADKITPTARRAALIASAVHATTEEERARRMPRDAANPTGFPHTLIVIFQATGTTSRMNIGNSWTWPVFGWRRPERRTSGASVGQDSRGANAAAALARLGWDTTTQVLQMDRDQNRKTHAPTSYPVAPPHLLVTLTPALQRFLNICDATEQSNTDDLRTASTPDTAEVFSRTSTDDTMQALARRLPQIGDTTRQAMADLLAEHYAAPTTARGGRINWEALAAAIDPEGIEHEKLTRIVRRSLSGMTQRQYNTASFSERVAAVQERAERQTDRRLNQHARKQQRAARLRTIHHDALLAAGRIKTHDTNARMPAQIPTAGTFHTVEEWMQPVTPYRAHWLPTTDNAESLADIEKATTQRRNENADVIARYLAERAHTFHQWEAEQITARGVTTR